MLTISVVIPNRNSRLIGETLAALRTQDYDLAQVEVLVVGLDELGLVQSDALVRFISTGQPAVPSVARNVGIRAARGDLICFTDADCIPATDWLRRLTAPFLAGDGVDVAGGGVLFPTDHYWTLSDNVSWFHEFFISAPPGTRDLLPSLNLCVRRAVIEQVGLFNEDFPRAAGEDSEWTTRMRCAGFELHFIPEALVYHHPNRSTMRALLSHAYIYGHYSVKAQPRYVDFLGTPVYLRRWWSVLPLAPLLSAGATARIYLRNPSLRRFWYAAPAIFLSKVAWCLGVAASGLRRS